MAAGAYCSSIDPGPPYFFGRIKADGQQLKGRMLPAALLLRVHGPATTIRVHTHGQGRPRSPIRQRQCNSNCLQKHAASAAPTAATCFVRDPGATTTTVVVVRHML